MSHAPTSIDTAVIIRRGVFFMVLIALTLCNLFTLFRGLTNATAMDQAQIAREISRGHGFTTKFIRPVAYAQQSEKTGGTVAFDKFEDTFHSPLNPLVNAAVIKLVGGDDTNAFAMGKNESIFKLDRVIAAVSTMFFLISIGVVYLLVCRIFDAKIGAVCALLMLFCETLWQYAVSGLPQMLMLMLFSCALYFAYRAVEATVEGKLALAPALLSGVFFSLLALTHWMAVWVALGYLVFAAILFRPRGIVALAVLAMVLVPAIFVMSRNLDISGSVFGTAYLTLHNGLTGGEDKVMRASQIQAEINFKSLLGQIVRTTLLQFNQIVPLLGGIVVAPLFFVSLLHPFKRKAISIFRWGILLMWVFTAFGLAFFGVTADKLDPNQIHLIFAPIMTAYGLALLSILWNRLEFVGTTPSLHNAHYIGIVALCSLPLLLALPDKIKIGMTYRDGGRYPQWPYHSSALNRDLKKVVPEKQMVYSDQPWAVAWYADRVSMWLPAEIKDYDAIESAAATLDTPAAGVLVTPLSYGVDDMLKLQNKYREFTSLITDGQTRVNTSGAGGAFGYDPKMAGVRKRFPHDLQLVGYYYVLYSERAIRQEDTATGDP